MACASSLSAPSLSSLLMALANCSWTYPFQSEPGMPCFALHGSSVESEGNAPKEKSTPLVAAARRGFSDRARRSIVSRVRNPARSQNARFSLEQSLAATFPEPGTDVRDESAVWMFGRSRSVVFRYGQHVSAVGKVFTRH